MIDRVTKIKDIGLTILKTIVCSCCFHDTWEDTEKKERRNGEGEKEGGKGGTGREKERKNMKMVVR